MAMNTTEYYTKISFSVPLLGVLTFTQREPLQHLDSSQKKMQHAYKVPLSAQTLQSKTFKTLETTGKAQSIQKLSDVSRAEGKAVGKRKKTNRKCHTQN